MNFKIGQDVVTLVKVGNIPKGAIKPIFIIQQGFCNCSTNVYSLGEPAPYIPKRIFGEYFTCPFCNVEVPSRMYGFNWYYDNEIVPLQTDSEEADMNEALAEISERELFHVK